MTSSGDAGEPVRVLVVEDDPDIGHLIEIQLARHGCEVSRAPADFDLDGADLSGIDVAAVDLMLGPEAAGVTVLGVLIEKWPHIRRVIVSAVANIDPTLDALAHAVVLKPWREEELWRAVKG